MSAFSALLVLYCNGQFMDASGLFDQFVRGTPFIVKRPSFQKTGSQEGGIHNGALASAQQKTDGAIASKR